jgi:hypothetical protein
MHLLLAGILPLLAAAPRTQAGIRLVHVPERVVLPAPAGSNLLLEVEIEGAADPGQGAVWLARDASSHGDVDLTAIGGRRFQQNLADPRVVALLPAGEDRGAFVVTAHLGGRTVRSAPVAWTRAPLAPSALRCRVLTTTRAEPLRLGTGVPHWLSPDEVERIDVEAGDARVAVEATLGTTDCPFTRHGERTFRLELDAGKRAAWQAAGELVVVVRAGGDDETFRFRAIPDRLELERDVEEFAVAQRTAAEIPGTRGWLRVRIDDVTGGQVLLRVDTATGMPVVPRRSARDGDHVEVALGRERAVLHLRRLVNLLIGDDHAEFAVMPAARFAQSRIDALLARIAASDAVFVREGRDHTGAEAAALLRAKLAAWPGREPPTLDVDEIASRSSTTGNDYEVRLATGARVPARQWLLAELEAMRPRPGAAK